MIVESLQGMTFYVAPNGSDSNPGTQERPFATLEKARDAVRAIQKAGQLPTGGCTVELAPGVYRLTDAFQLQSQDSGVENAPITYKAAKRGAAILSGGATIDHWQPVSDPAILNRLDAKAKDHVVVAQIGEDILKELPGFSSGFGAKKAECPIGLYQLQQRLLLARWPNEGFTKMGECLGHSHIPDHEGRSFTDGVFRFENPRLERWIGEPDLWFNGLWFHPWADEKIELKAIDLKEKTISLAHGHVWGFKKGQEFYAFNAISEIDRPGEWVIDRANRRIYLWPVADLKTAPPTMSRCGTLIRADALANVTFDGLVVEACRQSAVVFNNCTAVSIVASTVRHTGCWAIELNGGRQNTALGCDLYDLGEGGVVAVGGDRDSLTPAKHLVENNHIHDIGRFIACYRPGVSVHGVGNTIRHNLIYHTDHQAISFDGNDHLIEYNIVHDVCLHTSDAGALYACARDWSKRGTVIRHNLFLAAAAGEKIGPGVCSNVYLDDDTSGTLVHSNIIGQADWGIHLGGGKDNVITNNIVFGCHESIYLGSRGIESFALPPKQGANSPYIKMLQRDIYKTDLWRQHYPKILTPLSMDPVDAHNAHGNIIRDNVIPERSDVKVDNAEKIMKTCVIERNIKADPDSVFVNAAQLDFRLRPDALILKKIPNFEAPDFAKMGLYDDQRRASPAIKFGPRK